MSPLAYLLCCLCFVATYWGTRSEYLGDTIRYADDVVLHARGMDGQFWEFGHLLWRPWGFLGYSLTGDLYMGWFGDTPLRAATRFLVHTNFAFSLVTLILLLHLLGKFVSQWIAVASVVAMTCAVGFLNYSHSGAPYIPAMAFSIATILLLLKAVEKPAAGTGFALAAGVTFMLACALWFPYAFTGLGMLAILYFLPTGPQRFPLIGAFMGSLLVSCAVVFTGAAVLEGVTSTERLAQWIRESDNGWQQTGNLKRAVTGLPRGLWNFGTDTTPLKRWLLHDPYSPASLTQLWAFRMAAKLGLFYLGLLAMLWGVWQQNRAWLFVFLAAAVPLVVFAIALFEPSSAERFFPAFPFLFLAFAIAMAAGSRNWMAAGAVALLLGSMSVYNLVEGRSVAVAAAEAERRIQALNRTVPAGSLVFVVDYDDDVYRLSAQNPLDPKLTLADFQVTDTVLLASRRTPVWREEFAERTLRQWEAGKEVWVSERHLAPQPESQWRWAEGDDPRIRWAELPEWFQNLEFDEKVLEGRDGFLRVIPNPANRGFLSGATAP